MGVLIIAEAGINHNGNKNLACKMADEAKRVGADIIKFQTYKTENLVTNFARKAEYQINENKNDSQADLLKQLELSQDDFLFIKEYCDKIGITFLSTPFDLESIDFLETIGMPFWKIPSGEITNYPYLVKIAKTEKPVILSTGMCMVHEIEEAVNTLKGQGTTKLTLLHCNTEYPTPFEDVNLSAILFMRDFFGVDVGYSDHTKGIEIAIAAVALGATVIEKHFTLDRNMEGPDHKASLVPNEFAEMTKSIRNIEKALGDGVKMPTASETKNIPVVRKSIVASKSIKAGDMLSAENLTTKRPGTGISPMMWNEVIGKMAIRDFEEDDLIVL